MKLIIAVILSVIAPHSFAFNYNPSERKVEVDLAALDTTLSRCQLILNRSTSNSMPGLRGASISITGVALLLGGYFLLQSFDPFNADVASSARQLMFLTLVPGLGSASYLVSEMRPFGEVARHESPQTILQAIQELRELDEDPNPNWDNYIALTHLIEMSENRGVNAVSFLDSLAVSLNSNLLCSAI